MDRIVYEINCSLDGYMETVDHSLDWASVDDELHAWFTGQVLGASTLLYGTRMYQTMAAYWPTAESDPASTPVTRDYARAWNSTPKIVFSHSLDEVVAGCRLIRGDIGDEVAALGDLDGELHVAGADLAASFLERGLVDEVRLIVHPVVLGSGKPVFASRLGRVPLRRTGTRDFENGAVFLRYDVIR